MAIVEVVQDPRVLHNLAIEMMSFFAFADQLSRYNIAPVTKGILENRGRKKKNWKIYPYIGFGSLYSVSGCFPDDDSSAIALVICHFSENLPEAELFRTEYEDLKTLGRGFSEKLKSSTLQKYNVAKVLGLGVSQTERGYRFPYFEMKLEEEKRGLQIAEEAFMPVFALASDYKGEKRVEHSSDTREEYKAKASQLILFLSLIYLINQNRFLSELQINNGDIMVNMDDVQNINFTLTAVRNGYTSLDEESFIHLIKNHTEYTKGKFPMNPFSKFSYEEIYKILNEAKGMIRKQ